MPTIPTREEIEKRIPGRPQTQEGEVEKPEVPEVESETPGGAGEPETGKPGTRGRP